MGLCRLWSHANGIEAAWPHKHLRGPRAVPDPPARATRQARRLQTVPFDMHRTRASPSRLVEVVVAEHQRADLTEARKARAKWSLVMRSKSSATSPLRRNFFSIAFSPVL